MKGERRDRRRTKLEDLLARRNVHRCSKRGRDAPPVSRHDQGLGLMCSSHQIPPVPYHALF
ncbi:hypothetical protein E2C01_040937 [Portunus trituberculatus]|uniref:Uncharacterized protein n=1 Tax=Portunus trituberculatus TaxID=210409 RepID=A0A5B7FHW8_PORTR|nr:hypothetical protein [Portunus trituberculatus]